MEFREVLRMSLFGSMKVLEIFFKVVMVVFSILTIFLSILAILAGRK